MTGESLGSGFNGKRFESVRPKDDPLVSTSQIGQESSVQLDNAGSIFQRLFEEGIGSFDIDQIASDGFHSDVAKLLRALDDLDDIAGNVTLEDTVSVDGDSTPDPVFTVQIVKPLDAIVDLNVNADALLGEVRLGGQIEIRADVQLDLVFGVDNSGFFVIPDTTAGQAELQIKNFIIDGAVFGEGRLGFLGVKLKDAAITLDPDVEVAFDLVDPGTEAADGKIRLVELFPDSIGDVFDVAVTGDPGDAENDFVLAGAFAVKAVVPGFDARIDLGQASVIIAWPDLTRADQVQLSASSSAGEDFLKFLRVGAEDVRDQLVELRDKLALLAAAEELLGGEIPLLSDGLAALLDVFELLDSNILDPLTDIDPFTGTVSANFSTAQDLASNLAAWLRFSLEDIGLRFENGELLYDLDFLHAFEDATQPLDFSLEADPIAGLNVNALADVMASAAVDLTLGIDLDDLVGGAGIADAVFIRDASITGNVDVTATGIGGEARFGFLGITINNGTAAVLPTATLSLLDPGTTAPDGRITIAELANALTSGADIGGLASLDLSGSARATLPFDAPFLGLLNATHGTQIVLDIPDISDPEGIVFRIEGTDELFNFNNLTAAGFVSLIAQIASYLDGVRESELISSFEVPFAKSALDAVLDVADALRDALLIDDEDDGIDNNEATKLDFDLEEAINAALSDAGLADVSVSVSLRTFDDGPGFRIVTDSPGVTSIKVTNVTANAADHPGFVGDPTNGDTSIEDGGEIVLAASSAIADQLEDAKLEAPITLDLSVTRDGAATPVSVTLNPADTNDNTGLGDIEKLVDAGNAPTFLTADELTDRLGSIIAHALGGFAEVDYRKGSDELIVTLRFSNEAGLLEIPIDFDFDLEPILEITSDTKVELTAEGEFNLIIGISLGAVDPSTFIRPDDSLDEIEGIDGEAGIDINAHFAVTTPNPIPSVFGRLSDDAVFSIDGTEFTLTRASTSESNSIQNLIDNLQALLNSTGITVSHEPGRKFGSIKLSKAVPFELTAPTTVDVGRNGIMVRVLNPAQTELGFGDRQSSTPGGELIANAELTPTTGRFVDTATLTVDVAGESPVTVSLGSDLTADNVTAFDLMRDLNIVLAPTVTGGTVDFSNAVNPNFTVTLSSDDAESGLDGQAVSLTVPVAAGAIPLAVAANISIALQEAFENNLGDDIDRLFSVEAVNDKLVVRAVSGAISEFTIDVSGTEAAAALGLPASARGFRLAEVASDGERLLFSLPRDFTISRANDVARAELGLPVGSLEAGPEDLRITSSDGQSTDVILDGVESVSDVIDRLNANGLVDATLNKVGRIGADVEFSVALGGAIPVTVELKESATKENSTLADLATDLNNLLILKGLGDLSATVQGQAIRFASSTTFRITADVNAQTELMLPADSGVVTSLTTGDFPIQGSGFVLTDLTAEFGLTTGDAAFSITTNGGTAVPVTLAQSATSDNRTLADLVDDLNGALVSAGIGAQIKAEQDGLGIRFNAASPSVNSFTVSALPEAARDDLGFAPSSTAALALLASEDPVTSGRLALDLKFGIQVNGGPTHDVTLTAESTEDNGRHPDPALADLPRAELGLADLAEDLQTALDNASIGTPLTVVSNGTTLAILAPVGTNSLRIVKATTEPALDVSALGFVGDPAGSPVDAVLSVQGQGPFPGPELFRVVDINGSGAGRDLGISGWDASNTRDRDGVIDGDPIAEETLTDRLFFEPVVDGGEAKPFVRGGLTLAAPDGISASAKFGFVEVSIDAAPGDAELTGALEVRLTDDRITLTELLSRLDEISSVFDVSAELNGLLDLKVTADVGFLPPVSGNVRMAIEDGEPSFNSSLRTEELPDLDLPDVSIDIVLSSNEIDELDGLAFKATLNAAGFASPELLAEALDAALDAATIASGDLLDVVVEDGRLVFTAVEKAIREFRIEADRTVAAELGLQPSQMGLRYRLPDIDVELGGNLDDLLSFGDLNFDISSIIDALRTLSDFLGQFEAFGFLDEPLPLIGVSVNDVLSFADRLDAAIRDIEANPAAALQSLEERLEGALGVDENLIDLFLQVGRVNDTANFTIEVVETTGTTTKNVTLSFPAQANLANYLLGDLRGDINTALAAALVGTALEGKIEVATDGLKLLFKPIAGPGNNVTSIKVTAASDTDPAFTTLGLPDSTGTPAVAAPEFRGERSVDTILVFDFQFDVGFSDTLGVELAIPGLDNVLAGSADLMAQGALEVSLDFGIDLTSPTDLYVFDSTKISGSLDATGQDLTFRAALGPFGIFITGGEAELGVSVDASFAGAPDIFDTIQNGERALLSSLFNGNFLGNVNAQVRAKANARLPVYFPTETTFKGDIVLGTPTVEQFQEDQLPSGEHRFDGLDIDAEGLIPLDQVFDSLQFNIPADLFTIDFSDFNLFDNIKLGLDP
jgi:hypothetical protein